MKALELAGEHRGMLKILKRAPRPKGEPKRFSWWLCKCDCGNKVVLSSHRLNVRKSCGCLTIRHGHTGSPTWNSWMSMKHPGPNHSPKNTECCVR